MIAWIYRFHASLLLGLTGNFILAAAAVGVLLLLLSGIWLWAPRKHRHVGQALRISWGRGMNRALFDLHRVVGAYSSVLLALLAFTGVYMALPPVMEAVVSLASPVTPWSEPTVSPGPVVLDLDEAVSVAQDALPGTAPKVLVMETAGLYEINLFKPTDRLWRKTGEHVAFVDAATGAVLDRRGPGRGSRGDRFIAWMFPLHNGEAFGELSRALVCLLGVVPSLIGAAGFALWYCRRRARANEVPDHCMSRQDSAFQHQRPPSSPAPSSAPSTTARTSGVRR